jgi:hypothetical protein
MVIVIMNHIYFSHINDLSREQNIHLQPQTVFIDYEFATNNAATTNFPGVTIKGCFFHYTQCIWSETQKFGLQTYYKEKDDITKLVRRAVVLSLLPQTEAEDVWFNALQDIGDADNVPDTTTFTDYVTEHRVETHIFLWNHYLKEGPRTPNHLEGWHNKIKKKVRHAHPNIYEIIDLLQTTQTMTEITIIQYAAGARPPKRPTYRRIDSRLQQLKDKIPPGVSYSDRVCRCCFPPTSPLLIMTMIDICT